MKTDTFIRRVGFDDIEWIIRVCQKVLPTLPSYKNTTVDVDRLRFVCDYAIKDESAFMGNMLCDSHTKERVGLHAATCGQLMFTQSTYTIDLFMFVAQEYRNAINFRKLVVAYTEWAKRRNAEFIRVSHTSGYESDAMDKLYEREGFKRMGAIFQLEREK